MAPLLVTFAGLALVAAQSGAPTPLFPVYAETWNLQPFMTSEIFAAYILGLVVTLLTAGSLSDYIGRRLVIVAALVSAAAAMVVLILASGPGALIVGRVLQGVASGLGFGTLGAALLDHSPTHRHALMSSVNGILPPLSLGLGALVTGVLVEFMPYPLRLTYGALLLGIVLVAAASLFVTDVHPRRQGALRSLIPVLSCPPQTRRSFVVAAGSVCASWSLLGLYLGVGPAITKELFEVRSPAVSGLMILLVTFSGASVGVLTRGLDGATTMTIGVSALIVGAGVMVFAVAAESLTVFVVASVIGGVGFGAAFQGGLKFVMSGTAPQDRSGVLSLLYLVSYVAFGVPTLVAGALIPHLGLNAVVDAYAVYVGMLALFALGLRWQMGSGTERRPDAQDCLS